MCSGPPVTSIPYLPVQLPAFPPPKFSNTVLLLFYPNFSSTSTFFSWAFPRPGGSCFAVPVPACCLTAEPADCRLGGEEEARGSGCLPLTTGVTRSEVFACLHQERREKSKKEEDDGWSGSPTGHHQEPRGPSGDGLGEHLGAVRFTYRRPRCSPRT